MANIHVENSNVVQVDPAILVPHPRRDEAGVRYDCEEALKNIPPNLAGLYATILEEGIREPLLAQTGTNLLIAGHFRRAIALSEGWDTIPVKYMDVSDEEAYYRMLKDNWERNDSILHDPIAIAKTRRVNSSSNCYRTRLVVSLRKLLFSHIRNTKIR